MNESTGEFEFSGVVLLTGLETRQIPFLDRNDYLNIVNADVHASADGVISFRVTGKNQRWLALNGLKDLGLSRPESTDLFVRLKGSGGRQTTIYWDIGNGYNSEDCKSIDW